MAEIKKAQAAGFAEDSNAFAGGSSVKGTAAPKKAQQKQSGVHQPRDADDTSGQNVQRSGQAETFGQDVQKQTKTSDSRKAKGGQRKQHRKQGAFGQSDKMSENADAGSQKKSDFTKENSTFTEDNGTAQEERQSGDDYRHRDTYHQAEKRGHYRRRKQREHTDRVWIWQLRTWIRHCTSLKWGKRSCVSVLSCPKRNCGMSLIICS